MKILSLLPRVFHGLPLIRRSQGFTPTPRAREKATTAPWSSTPGLPVMSDKLLSLFNEVDFQGCSATIRRIELAKSRVRARAASVICG
ncbi:hypothetical protein KKF84_13085 [Myxococcota bacterium]|nr:hypothetical protein [Myxococcota bacterium]MBU1536252.1 hypothetical protein [Myxococcota bacterium]